MALSILGPRLLGRSVVGRAADAEPAPATHDDEAGRAYADGSSASSSS